MLVQCRGGKGVEGGLWDFLGGDVSCRRGNECYMRDESLGESKDVCLCL